MSQTIKEVRYNEMLNLLVIEYQSGATWEYHPVNAENYAEIIAANSLSNVIHQTLRNLGAVGVRRGTPDERVYL